MITLISKNTIQQYLNLPLPPNEGQPDNPHRDIDQRVNQAALEELEFFEIQEERSLRSLFDARGKLNLPQGLESPNDRVNMNAILKKLNLQEDGHDKILFEMLNRWKINKKIPLLYLFWMENRDQLQTFKNQIPATNVDADAIINSALNKIESKIDFLFFWTIQTFGLEEKNLTQASCFKPGFIVANFKSEIKELKIVLETLKSSVKQNISNRGNHNGNRGNTIRRDERRIALLSKQYAPAESTLNTIQKKSCLFLKLFLNQNSRSLLVDGDIVFLSSQENFNAANLSDVVMKKKILEELIAYSKLFSSIFSFDPRNIKAGESPDYYFKSLIQEYQVMIDNGIQSNAIKKTKKIFYNAHHFFALGYITIFERFQRFQNNSLSKEDIEFVENCKKSNINDFKNSKLQDNQIVGILSKLELNKCCIFDQTIFFAEEFFDQWITPSFFSEYRPMHLKIPSILKKLGNMQFSSIQREDCPLQLQKYNEIVAFDMRLFDIFSQIDSSIKEILATPLMQDCLQENSMAHLIEISHGNQNMASFWMLKKLENALFSIEGKFKNQIDFISIFNCRNKILKLLGMLLSTLPEKLTREEGEFLYLHITYHYTLAMKEKFEILIDFVRNSKEHYLEKMEFCFDDEIISFNVEVGECIFSFCEEPKVVQINKENGPVPVQPLSPSRVEAVEQELIGVTKTGEIDLRDFRGLSIFQFEEGEVLEEVQPKPAVSQKNQTKIQKKEIKAPNPCVKAWMGSLAEMLPKKSKYRDIVAFLKGAGFVEKRVRGHRIFKDSFGHTVPIPHPHHGKGNSIAPGTVASIVRLMQHSNPDQQVENTSRARPRKGKQPVSNQMNLPPEERKG